MIKRGVGLVTMGFGLVVVVVGIGTCSWVGNIGGVELPDEERISEMELDRYSCLLSCIGKKLTEFCEKIFMIGE